MCGTFGSTSSGMPRAVAGRDRVRHHPPRHDALQVVGHDDGVGAWPPRRRAARPARLPPRRASADVLDVDARHLLVAGRGQPRLARRRPRRVDDQAARRRCRAPSSSPRRSAAVRVVADESDERDARAQRARRCARRWRRRPAALNSRSNSTTGTGASGESRLTRPTMKWSSITSPTTTTCVPRDARRGSRGRASRASGGQRRRRAVTAARRRDRRQTAG